MHSFPFPDEIVLFLLIWACVTSYCHTKLLSFSIWLLVHTWTIIRENCTFFLQSFDFEDVSAGYWNETEFWMNCRAILQKLLLRVPQPRTFSDFQSQTRIPLICHSGYTALVMSQIPYLVVQATASQNGEEFGQTATIKSLPQRNCHNDW